MPQVRDGDAMSSGDAWWNRQVDANLSWYERALCAEVGGELFFPEKGESDKTRSAKAVCNRCDVRPECLSYALSLGPIQGVWGGLTEREREKARRKNRERSAV